MAENSSFKGGNRVLSFLVKIEFPSKRTKKPEGTVTILDANPCVILI